MGRDLIITEYSVEAAPASKNIVCSKNPKVQFPTIVGTNNLTGAFHQPQIGNTVACKLVFELFSHFENTLHKK